MKLAKAIREALDKTTRNGEGAWPISGGDLAGHVGARKPPESP